MAFNVFLFVFRRWSYHKVRGLTRIYVPICYGLPLIPALIGLVYRNSQKGTIYGGAEVRSFLLSEPTLKRALDLVLDRRQVWTGPHLLLLPSSLGQHRLHHTQLLHCWHSSVKKQKKFARIWSWGSDSFWAFEQSQWIEK